MHFESLLNRDHEPNPILTVYGQSNINWLVANYLKWFDPDDSILKLVGL